MNQRREMQSKHLDDGVADLQLATIGNRIFAVCLKHTAKCKKHSANVLSSVKQHTAYTVTAKVYLPSVFYRALGKDVAEC